MEIDYNMIRRYKDRIRIFFIIYFFGEDYNESKYSDCCKVLNTEIKIQKVDFLLRNPDYLSYQLIELIDRDDVNREEIKDIVKEIFRCEEPEIRRLEMERFFFGAYEDIDEVIVFLKSFGFIRYESERDTKLRTIKKKYYLTIKAKNKMEDNLNNVPALQWYVRRCELIKKYFGDYSGSQLKSLQYQIEEYRDTVYKEYINSIQEKVRYIYYKEFGEVL